MVSVESTMMNAKEHLRKLQAKVDTLSGISASAEKDVAATDGGDRDINTDAARATRLRAKLLEHVNATGDFATWSLYVGRDGLLVEDLPGRVQRLMDANNTMGNLDFGKGARRCGVYLAALVVAFGFLVVYGCVLNMQVYATVGTSSAMPLSSARHFSPHPCSGVSASFSSGSSAVTYLALVSSFCTDQYQKGITAQYIQSGASGRLAHAMSWIPWKLMTKSYPSWKSLPYTAGPL